MDTEIVDGSFEIDVAADDVVMQQGDSASSYNDHASAVSHSSCPICDALKGSANPIKISGDSKEIVFIGSGDEACKYVFWVRHSLVMTWRECIEKAADPDPAGVDFKNAFLSARVELINGLNKGTIDRDSIRPMKNQSVSLVKEVALFKKPLWRILGAPPEYYKHLYKKAPDEEGALVDTVKVCLDSDKLALWKVGHEGCYEFFEMECVKSRHSLDVDNGRVTIFKDQQMTAFTERATSVQGTIATNRLKVINSHRLDIDLDQQLSVSHSPGLTGSTTSWSESVMSSTPSRQLALPIPTGLGVSSGPGPHASSQPVRIARSPSATGLSAPSASPTPLTSPMDVSGGAFTEDDEEAAPLLAEVSAAASACEDRIAMPSRVRQGTSHGRPRAKAGWAQYSCTKASCEEILSAHKLHLEKLDAPWKIDGRVITSHFAALNSRKTKAANAKPPLKEFLEPLDDAIQEWGVVKDLRLLTLKFHDVTDPPVQYSLQLFDLMERVREKPDLFAKVGGQVLAGEMQLLKTKHLIEKNWVESAKGVDLWNLKQVFPLTPDACMERHIDGVEEVVSAVLDDSKGRSDFQPCSQAFQILLDTNLDMIAEEPLRNFKVLIDLALPLGEHTFDKYIAYVASHRSAKVCRILATHIFAKVILQRAVKLNSEIKSNNARAQEIEAHVSFMVAVEADTGSPAALSEDILLFCKEHLPTFDDTIKKMKASRVEEHAKARFLQAILSAQRVVLTVQAEALQLLSNKVMLVSNELLGLAADVDASESFESFVQEMRSACWGVLSDPVYHWLADNTRELNQTVVLPASIAAKLASRLAAFFAGVKLSVVAVWGSGSNISTIDGDADVTLQKFQGQCSSAPREFVHAIQPLSSSLVALNGCQAGLPNGDLVFTHLGEPWNQLRAAIDNRIITPLMELKSASVVLADGSLVFRQDFFANWLDGASRFAKVPDFNSRVDKSVLKQVAAFSRDGDSVLFASDLCFLNGDLTTSKRLGFDANFSDYMVKVAQNALKLADWPAFSEDPSFSELNGAREIYHKVLEWQSAASAVLQEKVLRKVDDSDDATKGMLEELLSWGAKAVSNSCYTELLNFTNRVLNHGASLKVADLQELINSKKHLQIKSKVLTPTANVLVKIATDVDLTLRLLDEKHTELKASTFAPTSLALIRAQQASLQDIRIYNAQVYMCSLIISKYPVSSKETRAALKREMEKKLLKYNIVIGERLQSWHDAVLDTPAVQATK